MSPTRCRSYGACELRVMRFYKYAAPTALRPWVLFRRAGKPGSTAGKEDARRYNRAETTPAHRVEGEATDARACAEGVIEPSQRNGT